MSVLLAMIGSFAALVCSMRIPFAVGRSRYVWTTLAAVSLGGGAVWSMHFIGMIGYQVADRDLRYSLPLTGLSLLIAIVVSAVGLSLVARRRESRARLAAGGVIAGLGVAAMHYTGMAAMHVGSDITYRRPIVVLSVAIAIGAALAAMWIAFRVVTGWHVAVASVVMAIAVCGMHYTAMVATRVEATATPEPVTGADPITLALLVCVLAFSVLAVVIFAALGGVTYADPFSSTRVHGHRRGLPAPTAAPARPRQRAESTGPLDRPDRPDQVDQVGRSREAGRHEAVRSRAAGPPREGGRMVPAGPAGTTRPADREWTGEPGPAGPPAWAEPAGWSQQPERPAPSGWAQLPEQPAGEHWAQPGAGAQPSTWTGRPDGA
ncbi:MHYT domain-containing protein [Parafrankia sp. FMc2]|uniref:MHYT domain-containing protein n=1 Tax=Parafrankia sp. FMc2 TaxID=3233196 RepID=UPI0034D6F5D9